MNTLAGVQRIFELTRPALRAIPLVGQAVEGILESLLQLWRQAEQVEANGTELQDLRQHTVVMYAAVARAFKLTPVSQRGALQEELEHLLRVLEQIHEYFKERKDSPRSLISQFPYAEIDLKEIQRLKALVTSATDSFAIAAHIHAGGLQAEVKELAVHLHHANEAERVKMEQRHLEDKRRLDEEQLDKVLKINYDLTHQSAHAPRACHPGTRVDILTRLRQWVMDATSAPICLLTGIAGAGKSAIARSFCNELARLEYIVASFTYPRAHDGPTSTYTMLSTLAHQIAASHAASWDALVAASRTSPPVATRSVEVQTQQLLGSMFATIQNERPPSRPSTSAGSASRTPRSALSVVLIIDGLDGCPNSDVQAFLSTLLSTLSQYNSPAKLFVTTRLQPDICSAITTSLNLASNPRLCSTVHLHATSSALLRGDIRRFFRYEAQSIRQTRPELSERWISDDNLEQLVEMSYPLFAHAAAVADQLADEHSWPVRQLSSILTRAKRHLDPDVSSYQSEPLPGLDEIYLNVLRRIGGGGDRGTTGRAYSAAAIQLDEKRREALSIVLFAQRPITASAAAELLRYEEPSEIVQLLQGMAALLKVPPVGRREPTIEVIHPSFAEFIVDERRCTEERFLIHRGMFEQRFVKSCLARLNSLVIEKRSAEVHGGNLNFLDARSSVYAALHWPAHLLQSVLRRTIDSDLIEQLKYFSANVGTQWAKFLAQDNEAKAVALGYLSDAHRLVEGQLSDGRGVIWTTKDANALRALVTLVSQTHNLSEPLDLLSSSLMHDTLSASLGATLPLHPHRLASLPNMGFGDGDENNPSPAPTSSPSPAQTIGSLTLSDLFPMPPTHSRDPSTVALTRMPSLYSLPRMPSIQALSNMPPTTVIPRLTLPSKIPTGTSVVDAERSSVGGARDGSIFTDADSHIQFAEPEEMRVNLDVTRPGHTEHPGPSLTEFEPSPVPSPQTTLDGTPADPLLRHPAQKAYSNIPKTSTPSLPRVSSVNELLPEDVASSRFPVDTTIKPKRTLSRPPSRSSSHSASRKHTSNSLSSLPPVPVPAREVSHRRPRSPSPGPVMPPRHSTPAPPMPTRPSLSAGKSLVVKQESYADAEVLKGKRDKSGGKAKNSPGKDGKHSSTCCIIM